MTTAYGERRSFRCIHRALIDSLDYNWDLSVGVAPSGQRREIHLKRKEGEWTTTPETSVFLVMSGLSDGCTERDGAFADMNEQHDYLDAHPRLREAKPEPLGVGEFAEFMEAEAASQEADGVGLV